MQSTALTLPITESPPVIRRKKLVYPWEDAFEAAEAMKEIQKGVMAFRSLSDIDKVVAYLLSTGNMRNVCLFVMGCNFGFRISDLMEFTWQRVLNHDGSVKKSTYKIERKNQHSRTVHINDAARTAISLYYQSFSEPPDPECAMFSSQGKRKRNCVRSAEDDDGVIHMWTETQLTKQMAAKIIREAADAAGVVQEGDRYSTHSLRKTCFTAAAGLYEGIEFPHDPTSNALRFAFVQSLAGHKNMSTTMRYLNFDAIFTEETYMALNLGLTPLRKYEKRNSNIA